MTISQICRAVLAFCLLGGSAAFAAPEEAPAYRWFPFKWYSDKIEGKTFDKLAMLVPVTIEGIRANLITQFDLGSDATLLYENSIINYFATRRELYAHVDTTQRSVSDVGTVSYQTRGLSFDLGTTRISRLQLVANYGDAIPVDSLHTPSDKLVGTIGGDFLRGKALVIDYPRRRMCLLDSVDAYWRARTSFVASRVQHNRLHIPLTINGHIYWALFDTGASLFPVSTDEATWRTLVGSALPTDTLAVNSWGTKVPFYGASLRRNVYLGAVKLPKAKAWFSRDQRHMDFNKAENVAALTGNALFVNNVVVLDFQHSRFGVVR